MWKYRLVQAKPLNDLSELDFFLISQLSTSKFSHFGKIQTKSLKLQHFVETGNTTTALLARKVTNKSPDIPGIKKCSDTIHLYKIKSLATSVWCLTIDSEPQAEGQGFEFIYKRLCHG